MIKSFFILILIILFITACKTTKALKVVDLVKKNKELTTKNNNPEEKKLAKVVEEKHLLTLLKNASSIKVFAYTIESADFATSLFKAILKKKEVSVILAKQTLTQIKSKKRYLEQVNIPLTIVIMKNKVLSKDYLAFSSQTNFIILDNKFIIKDLSQTFLQNINPLVKKFTLIQEMNTWNFCFENPNSCYEILQKSKSSKSQPYEKQIIPRKLPRKTKYQEYMEIKLENERNSQPSPKNNSNKNGQDDNVEKHFPVETDKEVSDDELEPEENNNTFNNTYTNEQNMIHDEIEETEETE